MLSDSNTVHCIIPVTHHRRSCLDPAIFMASTIVLKPFAARTTLQFSNIQWSWCSGDIVSANVPSDTVVKM